MTRKRLLAVLAVLAILVTRFDVPKVEAAITFDGTSKVHDSVSFEDPDVFSFTTATGHDLLVVCISLRDNATNISTVTFNGDSLTQAVENPHNSDDIGSEIWYMVNPDIGTFDISIDLSTFDAMGVTVAAFTGVDTADPLEATAPGEGGGGVAGVDITPTNPNTLIVDCMITEDGSTPSVGANQTSLFETDEGVWASGSSYTIQTTAVTETMTHTLGDLDTWTNVAAAFNAAGAAVAASVPQVKVISIF